MNASAASRPAGALERILRTFRAESPFPPHNPKDLIVTNTVISELLGRSNRLGADPRNTNYAGGNTSATGTETDRVGGNQAGWN